MDKKQEDFLDAQLGYWRAGPTLGKNATALLDKLGNELLEKDNAEIDKIIAERAKKNKENGSR